MEVYRPSTLTKSKYIGFRLNLVLFTVLSFYLITTFLSINTLTEQATKFKALSDNQFESAMNAAELARDAEVLAAQAIEQLISNDRSHSSGDAINQSLLTIYHNIRQKLDANALKDAAQLEKIDQLQQPFFNSLKQLEVKLLNEQELIATQEAHQQSLIQITKWLIQSHIKATEPGFYTLALELLNYSTLSLNTRSLGQFNQLAQLSQSRLEALSHTTSHPEQAIFLSKVRPLLAKIESVQPPLLKSHRATLAAAREARLHAQRLSGSSYNYFLYLKDMAHQASVNHQKAVDQAINRLYFSSAAFLFLTALAYYFIRTFIIRRLRHLNQVMQSHVKGQQAEIPVQGHDEIAMIARAFSVFVKARIDAEQKLKRAHLATEQANQQLILFNDQLLTLSETDELTQVANRRRFFSEANGKWKEAQYANQWLGIIMIDVDLFKSYNDFYGHVAGDQCLLKIAKLLEKQIPPHNSLIARYGGEEFIILLPKQDLKACSEIAQQLLNKVQQAAIPHAKSQQKRISLSLGVAACVPQRGTNIQTLISEADQALYQAKRQGRCQVQVAELAKPSPQKET